ncbi:SDR family NAD(P)-dependent oxidoreductase [Pseudaminobacter sp. NGMCC 1.201702]|uniref:SDR family NAD(P)-dependent oxidoreductase n=1 Tax=Pseudaminobacter sp. NGMCC 1.201702 TaxID=3391825 RepID=UPI0039EFD87C
MPELYRANPKDGVAWITGASTGIGRALALRLAAEGYTVAATARDAERLSSLSEEASIINRNIISFPCDVTDQEQMAKTVAEIERAAGKIVLAVFNAGCYFPTRGDRLDALNILNTFDINLFGTVYGLVPVVDFMRARGRGHIVFIGSASSYFGWPSAAAYSASKAALATMAEALKYDFDKMNIRLQVLNPGFIDTPLTEKYSFYMPGLMSVDDASARMARSLRTGGFESSFPRRFTLILKALNILPFSLRYRLVRKLTGWEMRPLAKARKPRR